MIDTPKQLSDTWVETDDENALRAHIFQTDDRDEVLVNVPEWRAQILVKALSGAARSEYIAFQVAVEQNHKNDGEYWKRIWFELIRLGCLHPKTRKPIFKLADRDTLMSEKNGTVIDVLGRTVQMLSKLDGSAYAQAKKNLEHIPNTTDTTNSLNGSDTHE